MKVGRTALALVAIAMSAILGVLTGAGPAQAAEETATSSSSAASLQRDEAAMAASQALGDQAVITPNAIPDAYRVCGANKCIWVEKTRYCPPDTGCGRQVVMAPWSGGYCSPSVGCVTINGRNYHAAPPAGGAGDWKPGEVQKVVQCGASVGLTVVDFWTRGFTKLALAGAGLSAWGCAT